MGNKTLNIKSKTPSSKSSTPLFGGAGSKQQQNNSAHLDSTDVLAPVLLGEKQKSPERKPSKIDEESNSERQTLYEHLVAFYFRFDNVRLMNGEVDVDGICDWTLQAGDEGIDALNARLKKKYGSDLDEFLLALATEPFEDDDDDDDEDNASSNNNNYYDDDDNKSTTSSHHTNKQQIRRPSANPEPFPGEEDNTPQNSDSSAVLNRPAIPSTRRRRPTIEAMKLDKEGNVGSGPLDHPSPPDISTQLKNFLDGKDCDKIHDHARYMKVAADHGLVALNSELLARFGVDLKGDVVQQVTSQESHDAVKFGVAMDNKILAEMQRHQLKHEDSGSSLDTADTHACNKFRLDTKSPNFGVCKCGFDRQAHLLQMSKGSEMSGSLRRKLEKQVQSSNNHSTPAKTTTTGAPKPPTPSKPRAPSNASSATSNETPKPHPPPPQALKPRRPPSNKRPVSRKAVGGLERLKSMEVKVKKEKPCSRQEFQLDMGASEFGVCLKCGWKKADHVVDSSVKVEEEVLIRPVSVRKDGPKEPCSNYKLDVNAESFGVCTCGFSRQVHAGQSASSKAKVSKTLEKRWLQVKL